ncbi:centromere protein H [Ambystoma mexicanum]|uniref:centromere protein H n=1 Tax=Ambystoma mexicanum TaxID=8296 RepID=UPI0037E7BA32
MEVCGEMEGLGVIDGLSEELHTVALSHTSNPSAEPTMDQQSNEDILSKLYRFQEQIKHQLMEVERVLAASEESTTVIDQEDKLIETAKELEKEILFAQVSNQNKTLTLQRIQLAHSLRTKLEEDGEDSTLILDMMKPSLNLCSSIMQAKQDGRELEEELIQIRKKRLTLKETGDKIMSEIQTMTKKQKEELEKIESNDLNRLRHLLEKRKQLTTLVQNVFQNLILGSRVNWAEDRKLREIVLKLELNADTIGMG